MFIAASLATALIWVILALLKPIERRFIQPRNPAPRITARLAGTATLGSVQEALLQHQLSSFKLLMRRDANSGEDALDIVLDRSVRKEQLAELTDSLRKLDGLRSVSYRGSDATLHPTD